MPTVVVTPLPNYRSHRPGQLRSSGRNHDRRPRPPGSGSERSLPGRGSQSRSRLECTLRPAHASPRRSPRLRQCLKVDLDRLRLVATGQLVDLSSPQPLAGIFFKERQNCLNNLSSKEGGIQDDRQAKEIFSTRKSEELKKQKTPNKKTPSNRRLLFFTSSSF